MFNKNAYFCENRNKYLIVRDGVRLLKQKKSYLLDKISGITRQSNRYFDS